MPLNRGNPRVFISCSGVDDALVTRLEHGFRQAGLPTWFAKNDLERGVPHRVAEKRAISQDAFAFVTFFSSGSVKLDRTNQRPEILDAIEVLQTKDLSKPFFIAVKLDDCEVPTLPVGGGVWLPQITWVNLFGPESDRELRKLTSQLLKMYAEATGELVDLELGRVVNAPPPTIMIGDAPGDVHSRMQAAEITLTTGPMGGRRSAVHKLTDLADKNPEVRQQVADVLCAYVRRPAATDALRDDDLDVRRAIIGAIADRLEPSAPVSWSSLDFNFTGATIDHGGFQRAVFSGGTVYFDEVVFTNRHFTFDHAQFLGGTVSFTGAVFQCAWMSFAKTQFRGGTVWFTNASVTRPDATLTFRDAEFCSGTAGFTNLIVVDGANLLLDGARVSRNFELIDPPEGLRRDPTFECDESS
jgi:hypothetical protein